MSESLEGLRVAATRQKAGRAKNCETATALPGVGCVKVPAATVFADVIVMFGNLIETRLSQDAARTGNALKVKIASTAKNFRTFLAAIRLDLLISRGCSMGRLIRASYASPAMDTTTPHLSELPVRSLVFGLLSPESRATRKLSQDLPQNKPAPGLCVVCRQSVS